MDLCLFLRSTKSRHWEAKQAPKLDLNWRMESSLTRRLAETLNLKSYFWNFSLVKVSISFHLFTHTHTKCIQDSTIWICWQMGINNCTLRKHDRKGQKIYKKINPKAVINKSKPCLRMILLFSPFSFLHLLVLKRKLVKKVRAEGYYLICVGNSQQQE